MQLRNYSKKSGAFWGLSFHNFNIHPAEFNTPNSTALDGRSPFSAMSKTKANQQYGFDLKSCNISICVKSLRLILRALMALKGSLLSLAYALVLALNLLVIPSESATPQAFRRDPGHPQWHHGAFHDVRESVRTDVRRSLHSRAEVLIFHRLVFYFGFDFQFLVFFLRIFLVYNMKN